MQFKNNAKQYLKISSKLNLKRANIIIAVEKNISLKIAANRKNNKTKLKKNSDFIKKSEQLKYKFFKNTNINGQNRF